MPIYDVIVVGMGAAGCMASTALQHWGQTVLGLEAMDRLGGRVHTASFGDGIVELGAEWIHGTENNNVYNYAVACGVDLKAQDIEYRPYTSEGLSENADLLKDLIEFAFSLVDQPPVTPESLGDHIRKRVMEYADIKLPNVDKKFIESFLRWMRIVVGIHEGCDDWRNVTTHTCYKELKGHSQMSWHSHGYKTLFDVMMNRYCKGSRQLDIKFNTEVVCIRLPEIPACPVEVVCTANGNETVYFARAVLVTLSLGVLKEKYSTLFYPPLPATKIRAIKNISFGTVNKVVLSFDQIWWPTDVSVFSFLWNDEDIADVQKEDQWTTNISGATLSMANDKCLVFWFNGREAVFIERLSDDEVRSKLMALVRRFMGSDKEIPEPIGMIRSGWSRNRFTRGSYSYDNCATPEQPNIRIDLTEPLLAHGKLCVMFAGEATHSTLFSTVHGAISSGMREAIRFMSKASAEYWPDSRYYQWTECSMIKESGPLV